jgi:hypothetical protein
VGGRTLVAEESALRHPKRPSHSTVVAYTALFVALGGSSYAAVKVSSGQIVNNTVRGEDIRNHTIKGVDVASRTLHAKNFAAGELPRGPQGPVGARGPSFGDGKTVSNVNNMACDTDVVVGSQTVTLTAPSRIWVFGQGTFRPDGSNKREFGLRMRLRNAANTTTLAASVEAWDSNTPTGDADTVMQVATGGLLETGDSEVPRPPFVAPAGAYVLQLVARAISGAAPCATNFPDFGTNGGNSMGYLVLGTG